MKGISLLVIFCFAFGIKLTAQAGDKPNIIFIVIDDLNDYVADINGHPQAITPGFDYLSTLSTTFYNTHASSPKCAPSRTGMLTGKDVYYTQVYNNPHCLPMSDYFTEEDNNEEVFILPEYLKSNGYFTYGINKVYHCYETFPEFDTITENACDKTLSWNKYFSFLNGDDESVLSYGASHNLGKAKLAYTPIPDSLESRMYDHRIIDSVALFLNQYSNGEVNTCENPLFIVLGLRKPHDPLYIPEKYFSSDFITDYYATPFDFPYNKPENSYPANGLIMPPQPDTIYNDFNQLGLLGQSMASFDSVYYATIKAVDKIIPLPEIAPDLTEEERKSIMNETLRANTTLAYLAAIKFMDAQILRFMDSLAQYPEIYNNSIIIVASDNGYSLGEKRHWKKGTMWDSDLRVPLMIADLRNPNQQTVFNTVSLLDLFPTICEFTNIPKPLFANGDAYLDGRSIAGFLTNPDLKIEKPALAAYEAQKDYQCSCSPQYSVRNDKFHYILYTSNNSDTLTTCNETEAYQEAELYEIGEQFEKDPNEWHNLIGNADYEPVIEYLNQWLPDSVLYMQQGNKITITSDLIECRLGYNDTINFGFNWYDTSGLLTSAPEIYQYTWTNNITGEILYGLNPIFAISSLSPAAFEATNEILFYLQAVDTLNNRIIALDHKYYFLDSSDEPSVYFSVFDDGAQTVFIQDFTITGFYDSYWWEFGEGPQFYNSIPGPITFDETGDYEITCFVKYGNNGDCINQYTMPISLSIENIYNESGLIVFPNPAQNEINLLFKDAFFGDKIIIVDLLGKIVASQPNYSNSNIYHIDISKLGPGCYIAVGVENDSVRAASFVVSR